MSQHESHSTTSHDTIRQWCAARDGHPARVEGTGDQGDAGLLRIDFGEPHENLERINWDDFFKTFDDNDLNFLYQEKTQEGGTSRFCKFVSKDS